MNRKPRQSNRKLVAVLAVAVTAVTLTGCATLSYAEAQASNHQIVETESGFLERRNWTYISPSGSEIPLTVDCGEGFLSKTCHASPDGSVQFRHSTGKGGILVSESITIHGQEFTADCVTEEVWGNAYICAPLPVN